MGSASHTFNLPPSLETSEGRIRRVGVELEFSGIGLADASKCVQESLGGERVEDTLAEHSIEVPGLGTFAAEIDWDFLKRHARESADTEAEGDEGWVDALSKAAPLLVPIEIVGPPIPMTELSRLEPMIVALREAGAVGTEESLFAAYGVHLNPEIPDMGADAIHRYLKAFALLQWWLIDAHEVDSMRRLTPYIDPWPEAYLHDVLTLETDDVLVLMDSYLTHNATRNRALDMLPLFAVIDEERVQAAVEDRRVKARPTFHYRLPNCHIERPDWSIAKAWNLWGVVERLAHDEAALSELGQQFVDSERLLLGVSRRAWVEDVDQWLRDRALA